MSSPEEMRSITSPYKGAWVEGARRGVEAIANPHDIDGIVHYLLTERYSRICSGVTPILVPDKLIESEALVHLTDDGVIDPSMLPSALWYEHLAEFTGSQQNFRARLLDPRQDTVSSDSASLNVSLPPTYVKKDTITHFDVRCDLVPLQGKPLGQVQRRYILYLNTPSLQVSDPNRKSIAALGDQARTLYPTADLGTSPLLWMHSVLLNFRDTTEAIREHEARIHQSIERGRQIEQFRRTHPYSGGIPGLSENR